MSTQSLLALLHRGGAYGFWWTAEGRQSFWWDVGKPTPLPGGRRNVYFGVHPTTCIPKTNRRGEAAESRAVRSQIAIIAAINCLFAEYDAKDFSNDKALCLDAIQSLEPPPSAIVDSGGGYHCYWLLHNPYPLDTPEARDKASKVQAAWVVLMGGDPASKDLARVLRVPGTKNYKYNPPRDVTLLSLSDTRYSYQELATLAEPFIEAGTQIKPDAPMERYAASALAGEVAKVATAPEGQKHHQLYKSAAALGELASAGVIDESTAKAMLLGAITPRAKDVKSAETTIHDGLAKGKNSPRKIPELRSKDAEQPTAKTEYVVGEWKPNIITAAQLRRKAFAALQWLVDGLIPEGAVILAGKPKTKKSWLALAIAVAVAYGGKAFGYYDVLKGRVLYLDLESNQRRMQSRLRAIIGEQAEWPESLDIATDWKRGDDGIAYLDAYCDAHPDTHLIVVDIWAKFRSPRDPKADPYEQDYNELQKLNAWAERRRVTVIVIHHTRKAKADDVFEEISGTTGIIGAVATAMVLARSPDVAEEQILNLRGRDLIEDDPIALKWDSYTCQHIYVATGAVASSSAQRRRILDVMEDDQEYQVKELAALVGKTSMRALDNQLRRLLDDNLIVRTGRGMYAKVIISSGEGGESGESGESGEGGEAQNIMSIHMSEGVDKGVESGLERSKGLNGSLHFLHGDSLSTQESPFWDVFPSAIRVTTRMMLCSDLERNQETARERCETYGVDFNEAKRLARQHTPAKGYAQ